MTTKLTLSIDEEKVKKIKRYTKAKGISVSKFFEQHIDTVTSKTKKKQKDATKLLGAFGNIKEPSNWKVLKTEHLMKKHGL
jgi:Family of unknown function (DUF6364)